MSTKQQRGSGFWAIQIPGWLLMVYLIYAQGIPALNYQWGVNMGTQEPAETITEVGAAFWYGFMCVRSTFRLSNVAKWRISNLLRPPWTIRMVKAFA